MNTKLKKSLSIFWYLVRVVLLFLVLSTAISWWRKPVMPANPQLMLMDYRNEPVDLVAMSETSPVLVYFWGTWCSACSVTSPSINTLAEDGYSVISIAVQSGNDEDIANYLKKKDYHFNVVNDQDGSIFNDWAGQVTPSFVILDKGKMTQGLTGIQTSWSLKLRLWLNDKI